MNFVEKEQKIVPMKIDIAKKTLEIDSCLRKPANNASVGC